MPFNESTCPEIVHVAIKDWQLTRFFLFDFVSCILVVHGEESGYASQRLVAVLRLWLRKEPDE